MVPPEIPSDEFANRRWIERELDQIRGDLNYIRRRVESAAVTVAIFNPADFVRKEEFRPIQRVVWTVTSVVVVAVVGAVMALIIKSQANLP